MTDVSSLSSILASRDLMLVIGLALMGIILAAGSLWRLVAMRKAAKVADGSAMPDVALPASPVTSVSGAVAKAPVVKSFADRLARTKAKAAPAPVPEGRVAPRRIAVAAKPQPRFRLIGALLRRERKDRRDPFVVRLEAMSGR